MTTRVWRPDGHRGPPVMRRPWTWRWLVTLSDLPPMPPYSEVVTGFFTKRTAEHEARLIRLTHNRHVAARMVRIDVERSK